MKILVLNCGSSSLKFQLIDMENEERIAKGNFVRIGGMKTTLKLNIRGEKQEVVRIARDFDEAIEYVLEVLLKPENKLISSTDEIGAVGHRIVHGGEAFKESVLITDEVVNEIEKCIDLAPLHNPAGVAGIKAARKVLPDIPMVAVFDTAFHQTMPSKAYIYQIPYRYYTSYKIRKYGFHGTSHKYVTNKIAEVLNVKKEDLKLEKTIRLDEMPRFKSKELEHLENNIFNSKIQKYQEDVQNIKIFLAKNQYSEIENVAKKIYSLVKENGLRYRDISIITKNIEKYSSLVRTIFERREKYNL